MISCSTHKEEKTIFTHVQTCLAFAEWMVVSEQEAWRGMAANHLGPGADLQLEPENRNHLQMKAAALVEEFQTPRAMHSVASCRREQGLPTAETMAVP